MGNLSTWEIISGSGPVVQAVLFSLIFASIYSWAIIFSKGSLFKKAKSETEKFFSLFWNGKTLSEVFQNTQDLNESPVSNVFHAAYQEYQKLAKKKEGSSEEPSATWMNHVLENVYRTLSKSRRTELLRLEKKLPNLATIASTAPFVGLFGTVWGIMNSFMSLSQGGPATLERVAPGLAEALIATAVGLAAAIPAVIFYNRYLNRMKQLRADVDSFSEDLLNLLKRKYLN